MSNYGGLKFSIGTKRAKLFPNVRQRKKVSKTVKNIAGIGLPFNSVPAKKVALTPGSASWHASRTPYTVHLTNISKATGAQEINKRLKQDINLQGFEIVAHFRNGKNDVLLANFAVVSPTNNRNNPPTFGSFFRDYSASRDVDFSTALTANELHSLPISTDKWRVLMHKRIKFSGTPTYTGGKTWIAKKFWVPLHRTIQYKSPSDTEPEDLVFLIYWFDNFAANGGTAQDATVAYGGVRCVTYFTETIEVPKRFHLG